MESLLGANWLVDTVIESFLLTRASLKLVTECHVHVSVFSPFIIHSIDLPGFSSSVHEFGIKSDIMAKDIWIIPTNVQNTHWVLMLLFMKWKMIVYLYSNQTLYTKYIDMPQTLMDMQMASNIDWSKWTIHAPHDAPAKHDSSSCGLFLCLFAHILCSGSLVPFPADLTAVRHWISMELISGKSFLPKSQLKKQKYCRAKKGIKQNIKKDFNTQFSRSPPKEATSTVEFLTTSLDDYYTATWFLCFMGKLCKKPTKSKIILCQGLCQDWYPLSCLDRAHFPSGLYKCLKCIQGSSMYLKEQNESLQIQNKYPPKDQ
ncbi:uncharacterized protein [Ambystoma mexicanum]|uniref:uncharacterized protein isoform X1 n=1 Tax=Ambystoma mexicanum TaxID=8296 RepID=UPI0037E70953